MVAPHSACTPTITRELTHLMTSAFTYDAAENDVQVCDNLLLTGTISGSGNIVHIAKSARRHRATINIHGNNNTIMIGENSLLNGLTIDIGNAKWQNAGARLSIGRNFSTGSRGRFLLPNPGNLIEIGNGCMFSNSIIIRGGEYPHLIFDKTTGAYLDVSDGIFIGDRVWVGEGVYINKSVTIKSGCVVGARSVVTRRFDVEDAVIAGSPARVVKENIQWVMNDRNLEPGSPFAESYAKVRKPNDEL